MRLDKLTIGSAKGSPTHQFKNLKNVTIDFDQDHWVTVVIGWNGTGKSNVLEALAIIFRDLIAKKRTPAFAYQLTYRMGAGESRRRIHIDADPDREKDAFLIHVAHAKQVKQNDLTHSLLDFGDDADKSPPGKPIKLTTFFNADAEYLPRYVFSYYSGESPRMHEVFRPWEAHEVSAVVAVVVVQSTADGVVMASGATETYANPTPGKVWTPTPNSKQEWDAEALVRRDDEKDVALSEGAAVAYAWALIVDVAGQVTPLPWTVHLMLKKK